MVVNGYASYEIGPRVAVAERVGPYETAPLTVGAGRHERPSGNAQLLKILADPAVIRIGCLAVGIAALFLAIATLL